MTVGSRVRVLAVPSFLESELPEGEWPEIASMLGEVFEVYEIDQWSQAWVEKIWADGDGKDHRHSLGLDPHEMERVATVA